jgi:hypothetical protein
MSCNRAERRDRRTVATVRRTPSSLQSPALTGNCNHAPMIDNIVELSRRAPRLMTPIGKWRGVRISVCGSLPLGGAADDANPVGAEKQRQRGAWDDERDAAARGELADVAPRLAVEEVRVLVLLARRLLAGQQAYGRLDLVRERRDLERERAEELADAAIYHGMLELRRVLMREREAG